MNKLNKELLERALVEGVDESYKGDIILFSLTKIPNGFHVASTKSDPNTAFWQYVCTKEEYLAAKAEKEGPLTEVDWSKAPEGATHHVNDTDNGSQTQFVRYSKKGLFGEAYYCIDNEGGHWSLHVEDDEVYILTEKPAQPVFTQAMADAGELPCIGSEFMHQGKVVKTLSTSKEEGGVVTFLDGTDIACCWNNNAWVNAIDTRTEKEKAIEMAITNLMFYGDQTQTSQKANETLIAIIEGKIHGVKWVGK